MVSTIYAWTPGPARGVDDCSIRSGISYTHCECQLPGNRADKGTGVLGCTYCVSSWSAGEGGREREGKRERGKEGEREVFWCLLIANWRSM